MKLDFSNGSSLTFSHAQFSHIWLLACLRKEICQWALSLGFFPLFSTTEFGVMIFFIFRIVSPALTFYFLIYLRMRFFVL